MINRYLLIYLIGEDAGQAKIDKAKELNTKVKSFILFFTLNSVGFS